MTAKSEWAGRVGQVWAEKADAMDGLLGPVGAAGIAAMGDVAGQRVLDLGSGAGDTSFMLADLGAEVTGLDVSPDLVAAARAQDVAGRVTWILDDAASHVFEASFDALHSRCGAMFFDASAAAWTHLRHQIKPGGTLAVTCWREAALNGWVTVPLLAARPVLGAEATAFPENGGAGPFGWADPDYFAPLLREAGWRDIAWEKVDAPARVATGDDPDPVVRAVQFMMRIGTLASRLRDMDRSTRAEVASALTQALTPLVQDGVVQVPTAGWCITAKA